MKVPFAASCDEFEPSFGDGELVGADAVTFVAAVQAPSLQISCVFAAESVTPFEFFVHVAVPELVDGLPITRMVSPAAATAAAVRAATRDEASHASDTDLAALVRSAAEPGLKQRIQSYRQRLLAAR